MTPYNVAQGFARAREADRTAIKDPDPDLIIQISGTAFGHVQLNAALAYVLQDATQVPLGTQVTCNPTIGGVTINTIAVNDGDYLDFRCILNDGGVAKVWQTGAAT